MDDDLHPVDYKQVALFNHNLAVSPAYISHQEDRLTGYLWRAVSTRPRRPDARYTRDTPAIRSQRTRNDALVVDDSASGFRPVFGLKSVSVTILDFTSVLSPKIGFAFSSPILNLHTIWSFLSPKTPLEGREDNRTL